MITDNEIQQLGWRPTGNGYTLAGWTLYEMKEGTWYMHKGLVSAGYFSLPSKTFLEHIMQVNDIQKPLFTNPEEYLV